MQKAIFVVALTAILCCTSQKERPEGGGPTKLPVESYELADFSEFDDSLEAAIAGGKTWPGDPVEVARKFMDSPGARSVNILREDDPGEGADSTTVIIVEDGYQDDSVRGTWHRFRLARSTDDTWRIVEVRRAYRCQRGHHLDSFSKELCT